MIPATVEGIFYFKGMCEIYISWTDDTNYIIILN